MRALIQRVTCASVRIDGDTVGSIGAGLVVLLGVAASDDEADARYLVDKTANLRIFADDEDGSTGHAGRGRRVAGGVAIYAVRGHTARQEARFHAGR
ncbi:D-aminoacyl-tRNA deacylase [Geodia barretti]|uniref:D-aminoacyl-tRNA deacylase n=1 Tax=Geodia barretti TaxID=519541 RepID=A0AA35TKL1_GEOBA|nr:D-aminoacyl-tRNA deacylase [Geodia barretti]